MNILRIGACLLAAFSLWFADTSASAQAGEADYQRGRALRDAGETYQSILAFEAASDAGHAEAAWTLGSTFCQGLNGVIRQWYSGSIQLKRAALLGHQDAAEMLFQMHKFGRCSALRESWFEPEIFPARDFFEECHNSGRNPVCTMYHGVLVYNSGEYQRGRQFVSAAGSAGAEDASMWLSFMPEGGPRAATASSSAGSTKGAPASPSPPDYSQFTVAQGWEAYEEGNYGRAYGIFDYHSDRGDADAYVGLGNMYEFGHGVGANPSTAMSMYQSAHNKGNVIGTFLYGYMIYSGQVWSSSGGRNRRIGIGLIRDAAYAGLPAAKQFLEQHAQIVARDNAQFQARLRALTTPCSDTYIRGETSDGRRYKVMRCD